MLAECTLDPMMKILTLWPDKGIDMYDNYEGPVA